MLSQSVQKVLIYLSVALLIVYLGYRLVSLEPTPDGSTETLQGDQIGQEITGLVEKLQNVSIDKSIFSSAVFQSLVDYNVNIVPEEQGKPDPFQSYKKGGVNPTTLPPSQLRR